MYDVTGVNVFPRKLMEFSRKEKMNSVPYPLLGWMDGCKGHNKPSNTLLGLVHARGTFKKFMNYRSRGYLLNRMTVQFSPCS